MMIISIYTLLVGITMTINGKFDCISVVYATAPKTGEKLRSIMYRIFKENNL
jgi:hypothetical protein